VLLRRKESIVDESLRHYVPIFTSSWWHRHDLRIFLAELRKKHQEAGSASALTLDASGTSLEVPDVLPPQPRMTPRMSPTRASWLFVSQPTKLDEKQKQQVNAICEGYPDLETAYHLSQEFVMMLAERRVNDLDAWLIQAERSRLPEFKKLAKGIRQDYAAVRGAFSSQWSNGQRWKRRSTA